MASGPDHYRAAERLLLDAEKVQIGGKAERYVLAAAQVHATLALAAATALPAVHRYYGNETDADQQWALVIS